MSQSFLRLHTDDRRTIISSSSYQWGQTNCTETELLHWSSSYCLHHLYEIIHVMFRPKKPMRKRWRRLEKNMREPMSLQPFSLSTSSGKTTGFGKLFNCNDHNSGTFKNIILKLLKLFTPPVSLPAVLRNWTSGSHWQNMPNLKATWTHISCSNVHGGFPIGLPWRRLWYR